MPVVASGSRCGSQGFVRCAGFLQKATFTSSILLVSLTCAPMHAAAEAQPGAQTQPGTDLKSLSLEELGNIKVITQSKEPEEIWRTPAAISVLTQEDIRRLGARNVPELLRMLPGVFVGTVNSSNWAVGVRGFTSNFSKSLLVLIDGRSVYTPLFGGVYWSVQDTVLEDIDRIELIRGPGGTVWGENAVNGVINIITKESGETHGALATSVAGNLERYRGQIRFGGAAGTGSYRIFAKGFVRGPEIHPNTMDPDEWHQERGGFRTDWTLDSRDQLTVQGDIYKGTNPRESLGVNTEDPVSGGDVMGRWSRDLSRSHDNSSNVFVQGYVDRTIREGIIFGERQYTYDLDGVYRQHLGSRNDLTLGAGYRNNPINFTQHNPFVDFLPHHLNYQLYSFFAQDEAALVGQRLFLTVGLKAEHNIYSGWDWEPAGRILYRRSDHETYWATLSRATRMPSLLEDGFRLAVPISVSPPLELLIAGNPHFQSEMLLGYEAGYRRLVTQNFFFDVAAFYNQYGRLQGFLPAVVQTDPVATPPEAAVTTLYGNTVEGSTRGIEFAPDWKIAPWWRLKGSYSLLRYDLKSRPGFSDPATITGYVGSTPLGQIAVESRLDLPRHFEFDQALRHEGSLPAQQVPAYTTADLRLGWRYRGFELSANGRDLIDQGHTEFGSGDSSVATLGIRRSIFAKIVWTSGR
jgi:iron complex outermembrane receptor protein